MKLCMCSLKQKHEFHLYGVAIIPTADRDNAGPGDFSATPATQMEQVKMLLQSYADDRGPPDDDPRQKFISALANAALQACHYTSYMLVMSL